MRAIANQLEMHARFRPDAEAIYDVQQDQRLSYAALHDASLRWAGRLDDAGVRPGDRVALLSENRWETFAILYAMASLGAMLQPMNWRLSRDELAWQLEDAGSRVLLADPSNADRLPEAPVISIEHGPGDRRFEGPGASLEDPWVLMYTSGTTGRPKGALLTHRQLHWNALNTFLACNLRADDSTLTFTPLFHTGGLNCLSTPLLHRGGRVVLTRGVDPAQALDLIASERIALLMGVPTIYQMLADDPAFPKTDLSSVRDALCGGAPLSAPLLRRYLDRGIPLRQGFGMTEVGPNCFSMPPEHVERRLHSVGKVIHHVAARLVRPDGALCEVDEPGELQLSGPAVFGGYWNNPEGTAAAFDGPWFRTGDVLSQDAEGFFSVRGRLKEMFISGGENVYPAEVEAAIYALGGVAQVAVIAVKDPRWGEVGRAFIETLPDAAPRPETIPALLADRLARFKIPKSFVILPALPRTASGKIDKLSLASGDIQPSETP